MHVICIKFDPQITGSDASLSNIFFMPKIFAQNARFMGVGLDLVAVKSELRTNPVSAGAAHAPPAMNSKYLWGEGGGKDLAHFLFHPMQANENACLYMKEHPVRTLIEGASFGSGVVSTLDCIIK